jgi:ribosomal protein L12E/L44/L45/RPP1/RPP2
MSVTRLKRKHRKNIARANNKQHIIKELLRTPVLKNVDLEELKSRFTTTGTAAPAAQAAPASAPAKNKTADNAVAFDDAEAVTKPVNEDGQEGEHPKPEIAL